MRGATGHALLEEEHGGTADGGKHYSDPSRLQRFQTGWTKMVIIPPSAIPHCPQTGMREGCITVVH